MNSEQEQKSTNRTRIEALVEARKQIQRSIFLSLAALVAFAVASYAWFANNHTVSSEGMTVEVEKSGFESITRGDQELDSALKEYLHDQSILCWELSNDSHLQNLAGQKGLHPDSKGVLTFYVVPRADGDLTLRGTLELIPKMRMDDADPKTVRRASEILRGHLLFACEYSYEEGGVSKESRTLLPVDTGVFEIRLPGAKAGEEYEIHLNWFWPYTLYEANNHAVYGNHIASLTQNNSFSKYFYYRSSGGSSDEVDVNSASKLLNQYYNEADQFIGDNIKAVALVLTIDMDR